MTRYLCYEGAEVRRFEAEVVQSQPGRVLLSRTYFFPGGGGQLADRGRITVGGNMLNVRGVEDIGGDWWHLHDGPDGLSGLAELEIDHGHRTNMAQLHTALHLVNAVVYRAFEGALVTGAQIGADRTARVDLDLPDVDNNRIRAVESEINAAIAADLSISAVFVSQSEAQAEPGLLRSKTALPPAQPDGTIRVIDIQGLDRQACGGTHLTSTGQLPRIKIHKVESKGRHNKRVRIGFA